MARNDRRGDEEPGGIGTMTRSRPGPGPRPRQDQAPAAAADVAAPAPRLGRQGRGRQARGVPPQRAFDGQQAAPVRRPPAEPDAAGSRTADPRSGDRRGEGRAARRPAPGQTGADPRRADRRGKRLPGADPRRGDQPSADPRRADPRTRAPRNAAVFDRQGAPPRTVPRPAGQPDQAPQPAPQASQVQSLIGSHRMPFMLLLCGLLGGALVSALVISTTLAAGSFQITRLQESTSALAKQRQALEQQVAQAKSAQVIEERASKLGMRRVGLIQFIDLKTGKTLNDAASGWLAHVQSPGYTP